MKCPFCRSTNTEIYNTRTTKFGAQTWRRRRCQSCHEAFTTYEASDLGFLKIAPTHGKALSYSRARLFSSVYEAFLDVPSKETTIDAVTDTIEAKILDLRRSEVGSGEVTRILLTTLKHFNTAAFMRYLATHTPPTSNSDLKRRLKNY